MAPLRPFAPILGLTRIPTRTAATKASASSTAFISPTTPTPPPPSAAFTARPRGSKIEIVIPPHATSYLPLPTPPQAEEPVRTRQRGFLPTPRNPFPNHEGRRKVSQAYFAKTVPRPKAGKRKASQAPPGSRQAWKLLMKQTRRSSLKQGLHELWQRKKRMNRSEYWAGRARKRRYDARVARTRSQMLHDSITRPTIPAATLDTGVKPDLDRFERAQSARVKHRRRQREKMMDRRSLILDLYHKATNFIINEGEFKAVVERIFEDKYFERWGRGENVWDVFGPPPGMEDIMSSGTSPAAASKYVGRAQTRSAQRLRVLAEEMTGGKMV